jgi:hypothetical protein
METGKKYMKKIGYILLLFSVTCTGQPNDPACKIADFNLFVKTNHAPVVMGSFTDYESCILEKSIDRYLNELNSHKLVIVDSLMIRNYYLIDINFGFSFVVTNDCRVHFIAMPELHGYLRRDYYGKNKALLNPENAFAKIDEPSLDNLLDNYVFRKDDLPEVQHEKALRVLKELVGIFSSQSSPEDLLNYVNGQPDGYRNEVLKTFGQKLNTPLHLRTTGSYLDVYEFYPFGYIILDFYTEALTGEMKLDLFFVSKYEGAFILRDPDTNGRYRDCLDR